LPASAPDRFASQTDRTTCAQAAQDALLQAARPRPEKFAERFFAGDCQRFLKIANDRQRSPTIASASQRFPGSGNDRQRQTTIDRGKSTHFQRTPTIVRARATLDNDRQRSSVKNQRTSNARQRKNGLWDFRPVSCVDDAGAAAA